VNAAGPWSGKIADKLLAAGCRRLITNARWRSGFELINLGGVRYPHSTLSIGWYACWCGATVFVPGPADRVTSEVENTIEEVYNCPACQVGSDLACQIQADLLGIRVKRPDFSETKAWAAALMAGLGADVWTDLSELPLLPGGHTIFSPQLDEGRRDAGYERWKYAVSLTRDSGDGRRI
jgi:hypothetical protein